MREGTPEFNGGPAFELTRLNRALAQLARPGSKDEWLAPLSRADLDCLGVFTGPWRFPATSWQRPQLIERLWRRKRQLLRQAAKHDGYGPEFPAA